MRAHGMRLLEGGLGALPEGVREVAQARRKRFEIASAGIDEELQFVGGDPYGGVSSVGLRVPPLPSPLGVPTGRYLFNLASFTLAEAEQARIIGMRLFWTLGLKAGNGRFIEQLVTSPFFKLPDGNVSWHMHTWGPGQIPIPTRGPNNLDNFKFLMSDTPALLYKAAGISTLPGFYIGIPTYTAPNGGRPWGTPLTSEQGTFYDLRAPWNAAGAWRATDIPLEGAGGYGIFASVAQTNASTRLPVVPPATFFPNGLSDEEQFLLNFPTAIIWRVAASLIVEQDL
jgi:hypothetical protein